MTLPCLTESLLWYSVDTLNPALSSVVCALPSDLPTTLGTSEDFLPELTVMETVLPFSRLSSEVGDWRMTLPCLTSELASSETDTSKPAFFSAAIASLCDLPTTLGTATFSEPSEST